MSKDLLSEATRALREPDVVSELEARSTRARVMTGLHQTRIHRRTRAVFLLPIAASFIAFSAWGAATGKARTTLQTLSHWLAPKSPASSPSPTPLSNPPLQPSSPTLLSPDLPSSPILSPSPTPLFPPSPTRSSPPSPTHRSSPSPPDLPPQDPTLSLYRTAHTAHFINHSPSEALPAWDAYLAAAPNGPFAPEARYNRALTLVRLGRNAEARAALEPFANGAYDGYRKAEASALLERLRE